MTTLMTTYFRLVKKQLCHQKPERILSSPHVHREEKQTERHRSLTKSMRNGRRSRLHWSVHPGGRSSGRRHQQVGKAKLQVDIPGQGRIGATDITVIVTIIT